MLNFLKRADTGDTGEWGKPPEPIEPKELPSIVGTTVARLAGTHDKLTFREQELSEEITRLIETRRQVRVSLAAVTAGLVSIKDDPALSEDERKRADVAPVTIYVDPETLGVEDDHH